MKKRNNLFIFIIINVIFLFIVIFQYAKFQTLFKNMEALKLTEESNSREITHLFNYEKIIKEYEKKIKLVKNRSRFTNIVDEVIFISDIIKKEGMKPLEIKQIDNEKGSLIILKIHANYKKIFKLMKRISLDKTM